MKAVSGRRANIVTPAQTPDRGTRAVVISHGAVPEVLDCPLAMPNEVIR